MNREGFRTKSLALVWRVERELRRPMQVAWLFRLLTSVSGEAQDGALGLGVGGCRWLPCRMDETALTCAQGPDSFPAEPPQPHCPISGGCLSLWLQASDLGAGRWEIRTFLSGHQGGARAPFPSSSHGLLSVQEARASCCPGFQGTSGAVQGERGLESEGCLWLWGHCMGRGRPYAASI